MKLIILQFAPAIPSLPLSVRHSLARPDVFLPTVFSNPVCIFPLLIRQIYNTAGKVLFCENSNTVLKFGIVHYKF